MKRGKYEITRIEVDKSERTFSIQRLPGKTPIFCIFIDAGDSVVLLEIVGAEDPKTKRWFYDRVKDSVGYVIRNWWLLAFVWDIFCGM